MINLLNLETSTRENGGYQNLIARALKGSKVLQSLDDGVRQFVDQLQPVQVVSETLVGFHRPGEGMAGAHYDGPNQTLRAPQHSEQVAADLKMRLAFSIPGKPQGRGRIDRFFRTINEMFLCDLDGYTRRSRRQPSLTLGRLEDLFRAFVPGLP